MQSRQAPEEEKTEVGSAEERSPQPKVIMAIQWTNVSPTTVASASCSQISQSASQILSPENWPTASEFSIDDVYIALPPIVP